MLLSELIKLMRPKPRVRGVVFYSFGEGAEGGEFYDSLSLGDALHPRTLLAYEMNFESLSSLHGAPPSVAGREPTWIQNGQVDQSDRVRG